MKGAENIGTESWLTHLLRRRISSPDDASAFFPTKKGSSFDDPFSNMAEAQRFELWDPFESPVFKTGAFNRSATLPK